MKNMICLFLCIMVLCSVCTIGFATETKTDVFTPRLMDINFDDKINAVDALWILQYAVGKREFTPQQLEVADVSFWFYKTEIHKGIDGKDALLILQYSSSSGPFKLTFPPERPHGEAY